MQLFLFKTRIAMNNSRIFMKLISGQFVDNSWTLVFLYKYNLKNGILPRRALPSGEGYRQFLELKRALNNRKHISYY